MGVNKGCLNLLASNLQLKQFFLTKFFEKNTINSSNQPSIPGCRGYYLYLNAATITNICSCLLLVDMDAAMPTAFSAIDIQFLWSQMARSGPRCPAN